ncbi:hypothetical protein GCM10009765_81060 [Fodinicola feengrottensis]|uniref:DUF4175 domain-containing protein n=2 Tax=Fodinicola feengrottensis TaxID=435914 RepID=A0ABP4V9S3_9ACTN
MTSQLFTRIMTGVTVLYGILVAIYALLHGPNLGLVSLIGALVVGGGWILRGLIWTQHRS